MFKAFLSADHVTAAEDKTIAVKISKYGGAFDDPDAGATEASEIGDGWYYVDLAEDDTDTLGPLIVRGTEDDSDIDPVEIVCEVATDKVGVTLASDGLDSVATTAPTGVAANFREMIVQLWRRFFKKATKTSEEIKTYADNGNDVLTTQVISEGDTDSQGAAT